MTATPLGFICSLFLGDSPCTVVDTGSGVEIATNFILVLKTDSRIKLKKEFKPPRK